MHYDDELRRHNDVLRRVAAVRARDHVLDLGCGSGLTTRQAARAATAGSAYGVDVSATAIERARELARAEGLGNVTFTRADAQVHDFPAERFDLAISRFGTMFFADPVAAFGNVGRALRADGRLVMMVWQAADRNEWDTALREALEVTGDFEGPDPFSLSDPQVVREVLGEAGFTGVEFADVREPVCYGPDVEAALDWVRGFTCTRAAAQPGSGERLRRMLGAHLTDDGVWFGARAWLVTARRCSPAR